MQLDEQPQEMCEPIEVLRGVLPLIVPLSMPSRAPAEAEAENARRALPDVIAQCGDIVLHPLTSPQKRAAAMQRIAQQIAWGSFAQGGVHAFGIHFHA